MTLSVEDNLLRCFKKFGDKATARTNSPYQRQHNASFYRSTAEQSVKKDNVPAAPTTDTDRPTG